MVPINSTNELHRWIISMHRVNVVSIHGVNIILMHRYDTLYQYIISMHWIDELYRWIVSMHWLHWYIVSIHDISGYHCMVSMHGTGALYRCIVLINPIDKLYRYIASMHRIIRVNRAPGISYISCIMRARKNARQTTNRRYIGTI